eukprot:gene29104-32315_t
MLTATSERDRPILAQSRLTMGTPFGAFALEHRGRLRTVAKSSAVVAVPAAPRFHAPLDGNARTSGARTGTVRPAVRRRTRHRTFHGSQQANAMDAGYEGCHLVPHLEPRNEIGADQPASPTARRSVTATTVSRRSRVCIELRWAPKEEGVVSRGHLLGMASK